MNIVLHHYWTRQVAHLSTPGPLALNVVGVLSVGAFCTILLMLGHHFSQVGASAYAGFCGIIGVVFLWALTSSLGAAAAAERTGGTWPHPTLPLGLRWRALTEAVSSALSYWVAPTVVLFGSLILVQLVFDDPGLWSVAYILHLSGVLGVYVSVIVPLLTAHLLDNTPRPRPLAVRTLPWTAAAALGSSTVWETPGEVSANVPLVMAGLTGLIVLTAPILNRVSLPALTLSWLPGIPTFPGCRSLHRRSIPPAQQIATDAWRGGRWSIILMALGVEVLLLTFGGRDEDVTTIALLVAWPVGLLLCLLAVGKPLGFWAGAVSGDARTGMRSGALARAWAVLPVRRTTVAGTYYLNALAGLICAVGGSVLAAVIQTSVIHHEVRRFEWRGAGSAFLLALALAFAILLSMDAIGTRRQRRRWQVIGFLTVPGAIIYAIAFSFVVLLWETHLARGAATLDSSWLIVAGILGYPLFFVGGAAADLLWPRKREQAAW